MCRCGSSRLNATKECSSLRPTEGITLRIVDQTKVYVDANRRLQRRDKKNITTLVVHRIEVSQEDRTYSDSAQDVVRFFLEHPIGVKATGGDIPYPLIVEPSGAVVQTVPLGCVTPHAVSHNPVGIGIACVGDFRRRPPSGPQKEALVTLCAQLIEALQLDIQALRGHDELVGGSRDPEKVCPGEFLSMQELRVAVAEFKGAAAPLEVVW